MRKKKIICIKWKFVIIIIIIIIKYKIINCEFLSIYVSI